MRLTGRYNQSTNLLTNSEHVLAGKAIPESRAGGGGGGRGRGEEPYLTLHCHHQNDFCRKMGSSESHFNVSLIVRGESEDCPLTTTFEEITSVGTTLFKVSQI